MAELLTIDQASMVPSAFTHVLRGKKDPILSTVTVNGVSANVTDGAWYLSIRLEPGVNKFNVVGTDSLGSLVTESIHVELNVGTYRPKILHVWNEFDDLGRKVGVPRLPGEKNSMYRRRLFEATEVKLGSNQNGLLEALSIELGLKVDRVSFRVRTLRDQYGLPRSTTAKLSIRPNHVAVTADEILITDEVHRIEPGVRRVILDQVPRLEQDVRIYTENGSQISPLSYKVNRRRREVRFLDVALENVQVRCAYQYEARTTFTASSEIDVVTTGLSAVTGTTGQLLEVQIIGDGDRAAIGLPLRAATSLSTTTWLEVPSYRVQVYELHDPDYYESLLVDGSAESTLLEEFTSRVATVASQTWEHVVLDRTSWVTDADEIVRTYIAPIVDAKYGYWSCTHQGDTKKYNREDFDAFSGKCPTHTTNDLVFVGVKNWKSGVGGTNDLKVDIVEEAQKDW